QKTCNFDCVYCEVIDRKAIAKRTGRPAIEPGDVVDELARELDALAAGHEAVKDIAFAGDGEPSTFPRFFELSRRVFDVRDARSLLVPVVLITNGSGLDREEMRRAHDLFFERGGVFWIKLDAGTEAFYRRVCRTAVPFDRILSNLLAAARRHPVVVQSLFFRWNGEAPAAGEIEAWARRLGDVVSGGGEISLVQVYTVARDTTEPGIKPLTTEELESIAEVVRRASPGLNVETFV
ncbi:MAG TPA: radical SAM protein, partial [Thermoanaerobaculia bacterium]|nr:radical SAM protein [Thermoanaerobaculia bacterium]